MHHTEWETFITILTKRFLTEWRPHSHTTKTSKSNEKESDCEITIAKHHCEHSIHKCNCEIKVAKHHCEHRFMKCHCEHEFWKSKVNKPKPISHSNSNFHSSFISPLILTLIPILPLVFTTQSIYRANPTPEEPHSIVAPHSSGLSLPSSKIWWTISRAGMTGVSCSHELLKGSVPGS